MAALRGTTRFVQALRPHLTSHSRPIGTKAAGVSKSLRPLVVGALAVGSGCYGTYKYLSRGQLLKDINPLSKLTVSAAGPPASQPSVFSQGKDHALYLWIHLKPTANAKEVARAVSKLQKYVDEVTDPKLRDDDDEIWAGVGFGPNFYKQVGGSPRKNFTYPHRKGSLGDMPSTGGDVFIHAKCNTVSKLFELAQVIVKNLPAGSVDSFEDIYSFVFRNGRDLSGFIDGTENAADEDGRQNIAVEKETGGSYVITQKWIHDLKLIGSEKDKTMEGWVGRQRSDSVEVSRKSVSSHVARMTGGTNFQQKKIAEIVRQSMPYGNLSGDAGLFFIGYAESPQNFEVMLDRMVGAVGDAHSDDIMRLTRCIKGTYWYFPGVAELKKME